MDLLKKFWEGWKAFGHALGNLVARLVLSIFYFTVFVPFGLGVRLFSDPLQVKPIGVTTSPNNLWRTRTTEDRTLDQVRRQF